MMASCKVYEDLRKEFKCILMEGGSFLEEDDVLNDLVSTSSNPKFVLEMARSLKEEGNYFFRKGDVEEALERYGYAGLVLVHFEFQKEEDKLEFFELAICILLNASACFSRQNEFLHVGRVCSIILEYSPNNVKALYRRAMAEVKLEKLEWAYWDLLLALEIEPKNPEVAREFEKVRKVRHKGEVKDNQRETPIGLGIGLSNANKRPKRQLENASVTIHDQVLDKEYTTAKKVCDRVIEVEEKDMNKDQRSSKVENKMEEDLKDGKMEQGVVDAKVKDSNLEPKYQFVNRRRLGSTIAISKKDYQLLLKGKPIQCFNPKIASPMTIRVINVSKDGQGKKEEHQEKEDVAVQTIQNEVSIENLTGPEIKKEEDNVGMKDDHIQSKKRKKTSKARSCVQIQSNHSCALSRDPICRIATYAKFQNHLKFKKTARGRSKNAVSKSKRITRNHRNSWCIASWSSADFVCGCRLWKCKRRKLHPPILAFSHDTRKLLFYDSVSSCLDYCVALPSHSRSCCIESSVCVACSSHTMVHDYE